MLNKRKLLSSSTRERQVKNKRRCGIERAKARMLIKKLNEKEGVK